MKITMKNEKIIKVLVADNSEFAKNNLRDFLESSEGIQLINVVDNGKDAYHFIMDEAPDIVLIDVILPVMDGFTVIEKVNANKSIKKKPSFIIISSIFIFFISGCYTLKTGEEIKPILYYDSTTNQVKGKCKLKPNKSYLAFEIKN